MFDFFEHPWGLLVIAAAAVPAVWVVRIFVRSKKARLLWFLPIFLALAGFLVDVLVHTDREKIANTINTCIKAIEKEDSKSIEKLLSENYSDSYHHTKERLMMYCEIILSEPFVKKNISRISSINIENSIAKIIVTIRMLFDKKSDVSEFKQTILIKMNLTLEKQKNGDWLIKQAELLEVDMHPASWEDVKY